MSTPHHSPPHRCSEGAPLARKIAPPPSSRDRILTALRHRRGLSRTAADASARFSELARIGARRARRTRHHAPVSSPEKILKLTPFSPWGWCIVIKSKHCLPERICWALQATTKCGHGSCTKENRVNRTIRRLVPALSLVMSTVVGASTLIGSPHLQAANAAAVTEVVVAGVNGVPANASAVVLNVTATGAPSTGYVTAWPCGEARPNASNLNYGPGTTVANSAIVRVGAGGKVCLYTETPTQLITDVNGWFPAGTDYVSASPARLLDTRTGGSTVDGVGAGGGLRRAGSTTEILVATRGGVAANASAVVLNVTATGAPSTGYVTAWPCGEARPNASNLNYGPGTTVANSAIVRVGAGGKVCLYTETPTQLITDVNGWFPAGTDYVSASPARLLDTRTGGSTVDGVDAGGGLRRAGSTTEILVATRGGVAANASAVVLNVTATGAPSTGYVTVWPCGEARPNASNLNFATRNNRRELHDRPRRRGGKVCLYTETPTQLITDVNGWFPAGTDYQAMTPVRLLDTRTSGSAPTTSPAAPPSGQFVETFTGNVGLERFDLGAWHRDVDFLKSKTWTGDHDLNCGSPDTQRTLNASNPANMFYMCRDHMMSSVGDVAATTIAYFSPKPTFNNVRRVSWDVNVTELGARQWWEVSVVPASFNSGLPGCPHCSAENTISGTSGTMPAHPRDSVVVGNGPLGGDFRVFANGEMFGPDFQRIWGDANCCYLDPEGAASKAIRRTFTLTDNGNGTMTLDAFGNRYNFRGGFPAGRSRSSSKT